MGQPMIPDDDKDPEERADRYVPGSAGPRPLQLSDRDAELLVKYWFQKAKTRFPPKKRSGQ